MTLKTKTKPATKPAKRINRNSPPSQLTKKQVADELAVSPATVTAWCEQGKIEHLDLPPKDPDSTHKLIRIPWESFLRFEASIKRTPPKSVKPTKSAK